MTTKQAKKITNVECCFARLVKSYSKISCVISNEVDSNGASRPAVEDEGTNSL